MKINWFSPTPPAKTGIATYTADVVGTLSGFADVTVWTEQSGDELSSWTESVSVRSFATRKPQPSEMNQADINIYHLGNHIGFHKNIWELSRRHPGIVILHDLRMMLFFLESWIERAGDGRATMGRHYGEEGIQALEKHLAGERSHQEMSEAFSMAAMAVENAMGVVVHNTDGLKELDQCRDQATTMIPLPYRVARSYEPHRAAEAPFRLVIFGFLGANRCLDAILKALASFPNREQLHLDIYGEIDKPQTIQSLIEGCNLEEHVALKGYVSSEELDAALASAHLALNLRYPTMGEASLSQLKIWEAGLPSLVSPYGWYAQLPDAAVGHVRVDHAEEDLHKHWQNLIEEPERYIEMGRKGREILERNHSIENYCHSLLQFVEQVRSGPTWGMARYLADRVGNEMRSWGDPYLAEPFSERAAEEIVKMAA